MTAIAAPIGFQSGRFALMSGHAWQLVWIPLATSFALPDFCYHRHDATPCRAP